MSYKFNGIYDRSASYGKQKIDSIFACQHYRFHSRGIIGIGFDSPELPRMMVFQCLFYLLVNAVAFGTAASETDQDTSLFFYLVSQLGNGTLSENQFGGVFKCKIVNTGILL